MTTRRELSTMKPVRIRDIWPSEPEHFTPWLAKHISDLGDALGLELDPEDTRTEAAVGPFSLDILSHDRYRGPVAIENQLGETDHTHLGQLLTYTAGYDAHIAVWVAGKFRDEHREALDLLNRRTDNESEFFGLVMEVWEIDGSKSAPYFRVVSAPNDWVKDRKNRESDSSVRYSEFFQYLVGKLGKGQGIPRPNKVTGRSWQSFRNEYQGFWYSVAFSSKEGGRAQIELYIDCGDQEINKERFDKLEESKEQIEAEIDGKFDWERLGSKRASRISVVRPGSIRDDQKKLDDMRKWIIEKLPVFTRTFDLKLAEIAKNEDVLPPGDN